MIKTVLRVLCFSLAMAHPLTAPVLAEEGPVPPRTIRAIVLASPDGTRFEDLKNKLSIKPGDVYSSSRIKENLAILYQLGEFSNIVVNSEASPEGLLIRFTLIKKIRIGALSWNGNASFSARTLEDELKIRIDDELAPGWEEKIQKGLVLFYQKKGYFSIQTRIHSRPFDIPSRMVVEIRIKEGERSTLNRITFTGKTGIEEKELLSVLRIYPGFYYSRDTVQPYIDELNALYQRKRYLKAKILEPIVHPLPSNRVDLEIPVEAGPRMLVAFSFPRPPHYLEMVLRRRIAVDEEKSMDDSVLEESVKRLTDYYQNEGYPFVQVRSDLNDSSDGRVSRATFSIEEGPRVILSKVQFTGNFILSDRRLGNTVSHQQTGAWIPRYLRLPGLSSDVQALVELYRANGFLSTEIQPEVHYAADHLTAAIEFRISEGPRSLIESVEFEGISSSFLPDIRKLVQSRKDGYYYTGTILEDKIAINAFYHKKGYADVSVEATVTFDEKKERARIVFKVSEHSVIRMGHIELTGNETTQDKVIMREIEFKTGDLYQEDVLLRSQRKIARLGYFQSVRINPLNPDPEVTERDVKIEVKERNAGALEFGAGYADVEKLNGSAELSHKNIMGTGRFASLRTEISQIGNKEIISYTEPWIFDLPLDARSAAYYELLYNPNINYTSKTVSGSIGVDKSIWEIYKLSLLYQYENVRYIDVPPQARQAPEDYNDANISSINPSVIRDSRNDFLNPRSGSFNALWVRWAARFMGGETQEVKISAQSSWYFPLSKEVTLAVSSRGGIAYHFGETLTVPISERFTLGGRSTVRGYSENMLGTINQTIDAATLTPVGGESMAVFNWELRYNLPNSIGLVIFFDTGNVWEYYNSFWSSPLKSSVGPGFRYNTPVGPLRFDIGFKLNREYWESGSEYHFTLGHAF